MSQILQKDINGIHTSSEASSIDYPDSGNDVCFSVEENSFWFRHRNQMILTLLERFGDRGNFADIGGGNGFQAASIQNRYPDHSCFLIEPGYRGCINAKAYGVREIYNCTSDEFKFQKTKITGVGLFDVLEHIEDDVSFLSSLLNQLSSGTTVFITVPAYQALWTQVDTYSGHHRRYTRKTLDKAFLRAGYKKVYSTYFFSYIPAPLFLLRKIPELLIQKRKEQSSLLEREKKNLTGVKTDSFFLSLLHVIELKLISRFSLGFGGSVAGVYRVP